MERLIKGKKLKRYGPSLDIIKHHNPFLKKWIENEIGVERFCYLVKEHMQLESKLNHKTGIFFSYPLNKVYEKLMVLKALKGISKKTLEKHCEKIVIIQPTGIYFLKDYKEIFIDNYSNNMLLLTINGLEEYKKEEYKHEIIKAGSSIQLEGNKFYAFAPETMNKNLEIIMNSYDKRFQDEEELMKFNEVKYWQKLFPEEFAKINS